MRTSPDGSHPTQRDSFYSQRNGEYVYDVNVTERLLRYRAHLSNVQRLEGGRLMYVQVNLPDTYGPR